MVREGTSVNPGDILVSGQIPILNDAKEITGYESCHSDADIFIQTQIHYENTLPRKYVKSSPVCSICIFALVNIVCHHFSSGLRMNTIQKAQWSHG